MIVKNQEEYCYELFEVDEFIEKTIECDFVAVEREQYNVSWPYWNLKVIEKSEHFSRCSIEGLIEVDEVTLKNEYIDEKNQQLIKYHSTELLSVKKGDCIKIVDDTCGEYVYVKKAGVLGWVPRYCFYNQTS